MPSAMPAAAIIWICGRARRAAAAELHGAASDGHQAGNGLKCVFKRPSAAPGDGLYLLQDLYMMVRTYDLQKKLDILAAEKPEILACLKLVKAAASAQ